MTSAKRPLRVFLCHASGDKPVVTRLYERLVGDGIDAWLDKEKLIPGQNWQLEISKAVNNSDVVIVCLSTQSVTKEGFIQKEIRFALDAADEKPDGTIFIIPARLENCEIPERINRFQWVDLFSVDGYEWLLKALQIRAENVGAIIAPQQKEPTSKRISSEKLSERKVSQNKSVLLIEGRCWYSSNEYKMSSKGEQLIEMQGTLRLTQESFVFNSEGLSLEIKFRSIRSIEVKTFTHEPVIWMLGIKYIAITYIKDKEEVSIGLRPSGTTLEQRPVSLWNMNRGVKKWIEVMSRIPKLSRKMVVKYI